MWCSLSLELSQRHAQHPPIQLSLHFKVDRLWARGALRKRETPAAASSQARARHEQPVSDGLTTIREAERILIERTVGEERGNIERAATRLGISRSFTRIQRHRIPMSRM